MSDDILFIKNQNVFSKLVQYNDAYKNYKICLDSGMKCDDSLMNDNYNKVKNEIISLIQLIETRTPSKNENIQKKIDDNNKLRNDLELKLQELYQYKNPELSEFNIKFNGFNGGVNDTNLSFYSGIIWTLLATSSLYIILVKL